MTLQLQQACAPFRGSAFDTFCDKDKVCATPEKSHPKVAESRVKVGLLPKGINKNGVNFSSKHKSLCAFPHQLRYVWFSFIVFMSNETLKEAKSLPICRLMDYSRAASSAHLSLMRAICILHLVRGSQDPNTITETNLDMDMIWRTLAPSE